MLNKLRASSHCIHLLYEFDVYNISKGNSFKYFWTKYKDVQRPHKYQEDKKETKRKNKNTNEVKKNENISLYHIATLLAEKNHEIGGGLLTPKIIHNKHFY